MAAKSKKRLSKIENKLLKLEKLELKDLVCSICHSILIEPVTLPCYHYFCQTCFNGSIENNALCCPLCRLRIGSWLRTATKQKNLVNIQLWNFIQCKFSQEVDSKLKGEDLNLPEDKPLVRLSAPGEIRSEYEAELEKLRAERTQLEQKQLDETQALIKRIQEEEQEAQQRYMERLKQDEILAQKLHKQHVQSSVTAKLPKNFSTKELVNKRFKPTKIDGFLSKIQDTAVKESPLLTDDNTSTDSSTSKVAPVKSPTKASPEMVPSYGKLIKLFIGNKIKTTTFWNKENGDKEMEVKDVPQPSPKTINTKPEKPRNGIKSLLVSLPLPNSSLLHHKPTLVEHRNNLTGSVDSMHQELCYFKPIERTTPISLDTKLKGLPLRVPCLRVNTEPAQSPQHESPPSRDQYLEGLKRLRNHSFEKDLPSAFVIALSILRGKKQNVIKCMTNHKLKSKKTSTDVPVKRVTSKNKQVVPMNGVVKNNVTLRRTRSMGSLKDENETTPKKAKIERKATSERKPHLRSDSKKSNAKKRLSSPIVSERLNNNVNVAVKNLSSPLKNCDVKKILQEQLRIEKLIEQEKEDLELARKMDVELNGRRQPRRLAVKRQITLNYALRPAKKLKV